MKRGDWLGPYRWPLYDDLAFWLTVAMALVLGYLFLAPLFW